MSDRPSFEEFHFDNGIIVRLEEIGAGNGPQQRLVLSGTWKEYLGWGHDKPTLVMGPDGVHGFAYYGKMQGNTFTFDEYKGLVKKKIDYLSRLGSL